MTRVPRALLAATAMIALSPLGCREDEGLTLRAAEGLAWTWLLNVQEFLDPREPGPDEADGLEHQSDAQSDDETVEQDAWARPETLRDCFVDDGWDPEGFKNPTEAIAWLTARRRPLVRVSSIDLVEDCAEMVFEVREDQPVKLVARVVVEGGLAKCKGLKRAQ